MDPIRRHIFIDLYRSEQQEESGPLAAVGVNQDDPTAALFRALEAQFEGIDNADAVAQVFKEPSPEYGEALWQRFQATNGPLLAEFASELKAKVVDQASQGYVETARLNLVLLLQNVKFAPLLEEIPSVRALLREMINRRQEDKLLPHLAQLIYQGLTAEA
ncbi:MAG TPA: hypothetical protein VLA88_01790 [Candidatus Saccharimonadales bacterium]|nr:hypothetical protein [Candidatus Saccharimonadales bacterium]